MAYTLRTNLDLSQVRDLKRDEPLRVAAVRDGRVLGSRVVDLAKVQAVDKLEVDVPFDLPPGESPAGVELRIGPEAPEAILPHYEALAVRPAADLLAKAKQGAVLDLGTQKITDAIYLPWWRNCHRYTLRGRVVHQVVRGATVCNQPVPGAVVEAYDVDRFFFWLRKTLITTTTTDADGFFTMTFRWCCWRWWFYPYLGWYIDQPQWEQLRPLLARFRQLVPNVPIPVDPNPPDPPALLRLAKTLDVLAPHQPDSEGSLPTPPIPGLNPKLGSLLPLSGPVPRLSTEARKLLVDIRAFYPWWWWQGTDCFPDVLFRVTQAAAGGAVIYEEPYSATRWNLTPSASPIDVGNLNANDSAVAVDNCPHDHPPGDCFKFTDVGLVQVPHIGSIATGGALAGYASPGSADEPFGGSLNIYGAFGLQTVTNPADFVDYYKLQFAPWGGNPASLPADGAFNDVPYVRLGRILRSYWGIVPTPTPHEDWIEVDLGPGPSGPTQGLYRTVESFQREFEATHGGPPGPWGWLWTAAQWIATVDTRYLPDGLAVVRLVGYRDTGGGVLTSRVMLNCTLASEPQTVELLPLALDNTPLNDVTLLGIDIDGVAQTNALCQELHLKKGQVVTVHFRVTDPRNHLSDFSLAELHRLNCAVGLLNASLAGVPASTVGVSNYAAYIAAVGAAARPSWSGGSYKVDLVVGNPPPAAASCNDCGYDRPYFPFSGAYDIRLDAWKRVTNGYGRIFSNESNMLVVVKRTDAP